jgi:hypothetical protein
LFAKLKLNPAMALTFPAEALLFPADSSDDKLSDPFGPSTKMAPPAKPDPVPDVVIAPVPDIAATDGEFESECSITNPPEPAPFEVSIDV